MEGDYLIVNKKILPDYLEKVIETRELLSSHEAATVTEAVRKTGISRNTYYKYKDYVYRPQDSQSERKAILSLLLKHEAGSLSTVLQQLSSANASVITISQSAPVAGKANVAISLDISQIGETVETLLKQLKSLPAVSSVHLDTIE